MCYPKELNFFYFEIFDYVDNLNQKYSSDSESETNVVDGLSPSDKDTTCN